MTIARHACLSWVFLVIVCAAGDPAYGRGDVHVSTRRAFEFMYFTRRTTDEDERRERNARLFAYLDQQLERYAEMPDIVLNLRSAQFHAFVGDEQLDEASRTAVQMLRDYGEAVGAERCKRWLVCKLVFYRNTKKKRIFDTLLSAGNELGLENLQALIDNIDGNDVDGDGVRGRKEQCHPFDDNMDSDQDGVPDGCDQCWGYPDQKDEDKDGIPDDCAACPKGGWRDTDLDGVPDGCDNCDKVVNPMVPRPPHDRLHKRRCDCEKLPYADCCWQVNSDGDWFGDACDDKPPMRRTSIVRGDGRLLQKWEYNDFGKESRVIKYGEDEKPITIITTEYNQYRELIRTTETAVDGLTPPRTTKYVRDDEGNFLGKIEDWEANQEPFYYRNKNNQVIKVTTAHDPPEEATVLKRFEYDQKRRLTKREELIPETGRLEVVLAVKHTDQDDGGRVEEVRRRHDEDSEVLTIQGFDAYWNRLAWIKEYPTPISPRGAEPNEEPIVTKYLHQEAPGSEFPPAWERDTIVHPNGEREVKFRSRSGPHGKDGTRHVWEEYTTTVENPTDDQKKNWTKEISLVIDRIDHVVERHHSDGSVTEFKRDPDDPYVVIGEVSRTPTEDGAVVVIRRFRHDEVGRVISEEVDDGELRVTNEYEFDYRNHRTLERRIDRLGTVARHIQYDSFDEIKLEYYVVSMRGASMLLPNVSVSLQEPRAAHQAMLAASVSLYNREGRGYDDADCEVIDATYRVTLAPRKGAGGTIRSDKKLAEAEIESMIAWLPDPQIVDPRESRVMLCGDTPGHLRELIITQGGREAVLRLWLLVVRAPGDSVWVATLTVTIQPQEGRKTGDCGRANKFADYLLTFCPSMNSFDLDEALETVDLPDG